MCSAIVLVCYDVDAEVIHHAALVAHIFTTVKVHRECQATIVFYQKLQFPEESACSSLDDGGLCPCCQALPLKLIPSGWGHVWVMAGFEGILGLVVHSIILFLK